MLDLFLRSFNGIRERLLSIIPAVIFSVNFLIILSVDYQ
jgi:hypothetical protein